MLKCSNYEIRTSQTQLRMHENCKVLHWTHVHQLPIPDFCFHNHRARFRSKKRLTSSTLNYTRSSQYVRRYLHATYIITASSVDPKTNSEFSCLKLLLLCRQMTLYCDFFCFMLNLLRCALNNTFHVYGWQYRGQRSTTALVHNPKWTNTAYCYN